MQIKLILRTTVLAAILLLTSISFAQNLWEDGGVPVRQGDFVMWDKTSAVNNAGETFILWTDMRNGAYHAYAQKFDISGNPSWEEDGALMGSAVLYCYSKPVICASEDGGIIAAWMGRETEGYADDIKVQKFDALGNIVWDAQGINICDIANASVFEPRIISDGLSGAFIVWQDRRNGNYRDIYAQRILPNGSIAPGWEANGNVVTIAADEQIYEAKGALCSDSAGGIVVVWADKRSGYLDIYAQRMSSSGEALWQADGSPVCTFTSNQEYPNIATDGGGGFYIAWRDARNYNQTKLDIYMSHIDEDGSEIWTPDGIPVCNSPERQWYQRIASDGSGGVYAIWEDYRYSYLHSDVFCQRIDTQGNMLWQIGGVAVCTETNSQKSVEISLHSDDGIVAVWDDARSGSYYPDIYSQFISTDGQPLWQTDGIPIGSAEYKQNLSNLHTLPDDNIAYFWVDRRNDSPDIYHQQVDSDGNIQLPINGDLIIDGLDGNAYNPSLVSFPDDKYLSVWSDYRYEYSHRAPLYYQIMDIDGNFQFEADGIPLSEIESEYLNDGPHTAISSDDCALICWAQEYDPYTYQRVIAQKLDSEGDKIWGENGILVSTAGEWPQESSCICSDGQGGAFVAFETYNDLNETKAYIQRIDSEGNLPWGEEATQVFRFENDEEYWCGIVPDGAGNAIIVSCVGAWMTYYDIVAARALANGEIDWVATVCDSVSMYQVTPSIIPGQDGFSIIAWRDNRQGNYDIYAQRVNNDGTCVWQENGIPVIDLESTQATFEMVEDHLGLVHFIWSDFRNAIDYDIYYQKLAPDGSKIFAEDGIPVCTAEGDQDAPMLVLDGAGGVMAAWQDNRDVDYQIYAVHLDADGLIAAPVWNPNGNSVSGDNFDAINPFLASDNHGGAVIVWEDYSLNGLDYEPEYFNIYAQRVNDFSAGIAGPIISAIPNEYSLSQNYPNPFNASTTISFKLQAPSSTELKIFDITGREVWSKADGSWQLAAGQHSVVWDASGMASGVYFVRLEAGEFMQVRKLLLIK